MGKGERNFHCGTLHHIIERGNNKNYIYKDTENKKKFFELLLQAMEECDFKILYYVLMDNHYHLIIESGEIQASVGFHSLNNLYSKYYNKKYNRTGGNYEGKYTSILITSARQYFQVLKYIANNPVRAKIVKNARDYRWSAHASFISGDNSIVEIERALSYFPSPKAQVMEDYINLIEEGMKANYDYGLVPVKEAQLLSDSLDYILNSLNFSEDVFTKIKNGDKRSDIKPERDCFIKEAYEAGFKIREIAEHISFTYEGVRKVVRG
ncbi:MAG TPA: transposase [Clostridiales bacterium]|nr:transposase [Clostridiales bacterium]